MGTITNESKIYLKLLLPFHDRRQYRCYLIILTRKTFIGDLEFAGVNNLSGTVNLGGQTGAIGTDHRGQLE